MTTLRCTTAAALLCASLIGPAAHAAGAYGTANDMPAGRFNKEDYALMMTRVNQALQAEKDGETLDWKSDKTKASGSVTALGRYSSEGQSCRRLRIHNAYGDIKAQGVYRFCETPAGKWKLIGPDPSPG